MMTFVNILLLGVILSLAIIATIRAGRLAQAEHKHSMLAGSYRTAIDSYDGEGISLLCGAGSGHHLEQLLAVEYPHYEVVMVIDANDDNALFRRIIDHFSMVRVNRTSSHEVPSVGIRALYRSCHRRFRRLILIDKLHTTQNDGFNAAACYCSYENLLPLPDGCMLLPDAIERLVVALAECEGEEKSVICSRSGATAILYSRDEIISAGGFTSESLNRIARSRRYYIDEPIFSESPHRRTLARLGLGLNSYSEGSPSSLRQRIELWLTRLLTLLALLSLIAVSTWMGVPMFISALLTIMLVASVAYYATTLSIAEYSHLPLDDDEMASGEEKLAK